MTARDAAASSPVRPTFVRWRICGLMIVASFVAYLLRTNMSVAGAPMAAELGLSRMELGVVLSGFAWGYALLQFPGGIWGDRLSARRALPIIAVWWGLLNLLVAFVPGRVAGSVVLAIGVLTVLRFLMGAAQAPLFPIIGGGTTCKWFPVSGWALPNALQNFGLTFGAAATAPLIVWLMDRAGWRGSFLLTGPAAFLLAAAWWWYMRDRPSAHPGVNAQERELIEAGRSAAELAAAEPGGWRAVLGNRQVQVIALGYFCANYLFYFFFNWLFVYLIEARGFKLLEEAGRPQSPGWPAASEPSRGAGCATVYGNASAHAGPAAISGQPGWPSRGHFCSWRPRRRIRSWRSSSSLYLAAEQFTDAIYWAAAIAVAGRHASAACGVMNTGGNIVGGVGALLVPLIVERLGWPAALASASLFALAGAGLWLVTSADRRIEAEPHPEAVEAVA